MLYKNNDFSSSKEQQRIGLLRQSLRVKDVIMMASILNFTLVLSKTLNINWSRALLLFMLPTFFRQEIKHFFHVEAEQQQMWF